MLDHLRVRVGRAHVMDAALAIQMHMHKAIGVRKLDDTVMKSHHNVTAIMRSDA